MDSLKIILYSGVVFNAALVLLIIILVRKARAKHISQSHIKRKQMLEQGKIISAQENLLKTKQELLKEKEELLDEYRKNLE
jgi:hypothetical protein